MTKIGVNIKKIRTTKGLSQQAFADLFDLTRGNISSYEENRAEPRIETIVRIANYFCIPLEQFLSQNLTINEILKFNGDKLLGEQQRLINRQLREVPFMNEQVYMKCTYGEIAFNDWSTFPRLVLPEAGSGNLIALNFNPHIPHHESLPAYQLNDVLIFEEVTRENVHLCQSKTGLYTAERDIMVGQYAIKGAEIDLVLSDFKKQRFSFDHPHVFWRLLAVYQHTN